MFDKRPKTSTFRISQQAGLTIVLAIGLAQLVVISTSTAYPFKDDAFISLQYAKNLIAGNGLVFNPGEVVEGFTNPLWTLLASAVLALQLPDMLSLQVLGGFSFLALIHAAYRIGRIIGMQGWLRFAAPLIIATSGSLAYWSLSGMETIPFAWAVMEGIGSLLAAHRRGARSSISGGVFFGLATLLRPEAAAYFAIATAMLYFGKVVKTGPDGNAGKQETGPVPEQKKSSPTTPLRSLFSMLACYAAPVGAWQLLRAAYYHAWLPNTFYAKIETDGLAHIFLRGLSYLASNLPTSAWALLLLFAMMAPGFWKKKEAMLPAALAVFHLLYVTAIGGDYLVLGRFIAPVVPLLAVSFAAAYQPAADCAAAGRSLLPAISSKSLIFLSVLLCCYGLIAYFLPFSCRSTDLYTIRYMRAAQWLAANTSPETLVATPAIGAIGYMGNVRVLDMLGLINPDIARNNDPRLSGMPTQAGHGKFNLDFVLQRAPEIILLCNVWLRPQPLTPQTANANIHFMYPGDVLLFAEPKFFERYQIINFKMEDGEWFGMAVRRDSKFHPQHPDYAWPRKYIWGSR